MTLIELVLVVLIMAIIAMIVVSRVDKFQREAAVAAAESDLKAIREAFMDEETGYLRDMSSIPGFSPGCLRVANLLIATNLWGAVSEGDYVSVAYKVADRYDTRARERGAAEWTEFVSWNRETGRGWRGPYLKVWNGAFPPRGDPASDARGFYPDVFGLELPADIASGEYGCSVYGYPGEPAVLDPWGNPYVLQIPPPPAFVVASSNLAAEVRFGYARVVSAGPDGRLDTPCFAVNATNVFDGVWGERYRRMSRQAGLVDGNDRSARGDDLVLFLSRNDIDEGEDFER